MWTLIKKDEWRLLAFEMRCYWNLLGVHWQQKVTGEDIRIKLGRQVSYGHYWSKEITTVWLICRMPDDRLLKHMLTGTLQGTRCRGRQPNTGLMTLLGGQDYSSVKLWSTRSSVIAMEGICVQPIQSFLTIGTWTEVVKLLRRNFIGNEWQIQCSQVMLNSMHQSRKLCILTVDSQHCLKRLLL